MLESKKLFEEAQKYIPGGVNSPVRACRSVSADPIFIKSAKGSRMVSEDGREYIDYVLSWGPMLLGHAHPKVVEAVLKTVEKGSSFGAPCREEVEIARMIVEAMPAVDMVRMVNSGTEATMSALRLARAYTGRNLVLKFEGCYHGHADAFLASAGSGLATLSIPDTPGVPEQTVSHTLTVPYNDPDAVREIFQSRGKEIAAVIVEPVAGNMGCILPADGFLEGLREVTNEYGSLLIFDEVIPGFRVAFGGAQSRFGITPDLTCLGKIIGGGFPVGAYGGKKEIMERIAPCGNVYQAGTLSGNPAAMAAGLATLQILSESDYQALEKRTAALAQEWKQALENAGQPIQLNHIASMFTLFLSREPVTDFSSAKKADAKRFTEYFGHMRESGIYLAPSGFECTFTSFAHGEGDFEKTLEAARKVRFS
ncbi:MAG: glutamate-1-semialdehyde 2,1-aminomutase [Desulfovibrionales bacterium]